MRFNAASDGLHHAKPKTKENMLTCAENRKKSNASKCKRFSARSRVPKCMKKCEDIKGPILTKSSMRSKDPMWLILLRTSGKSEFTRSRAGKTASMRAYDCSAENDPACTEFKAGGTKSVCAELCKDEKALVCMRPIAGIDGPTSAKLRRGREAPSSTESKAANGEPHQDILKVSIGSPERAKL